MEVEGRKADMKQFLKIWLKHPVSVTGMIIALVLAIQTRSFYPVIILIIPCGFLFAIWELGLFSYHLEKDLWRSLARNIKELKEMDNNQ